MTKHTNDNHLLFWTSCLWRRGEWPQDVSLSGWLISFQTGLNLTSAMWHLFSKQGLDYHGEKLTGQAYTYHYLVCWGSRGLWQGWGWWLSWCPLLTQTGQIQCELTSSAFGSCLSEAPLSERRKGQPQWAARILKELHNFCFVMQPHLPPPTVCCVFRLIHWEDFLTKMLNIDERRNNGLYSNTCISFRP